MESGNGDVLLGVLEWSVVALLVLIALALVSVLVMYVIDVNQTRQARHKLRNHPLRGMNRQLHPPGNLGCVFLDKLGGFSVVFHRQTPDQ